ncbi:2-hydroxyacylsphingosine 1-beta-galactosyltransferase [Stylophora pistillata]|uniref:2-hydroxyacylsphingosine 1-beta-galactosyltransferase n=2 Tax=Stylophora pistillata TaxID=50429 RepID=A0A2B4RF01_STYPI|nr:2-hydroxyacylsphingosine 1-beta-galactosyltransferase [Stylophora pistillata]
MTDHKTDMVVTVLASLCFLVTFIQASDSHIVGIPSIGTSHGLVYVKIGRELAKRGYRYSLVVPTWQANEIGPSLYGIAVKSYNSQTNADDLEKVIIREAEGKLNITERNDFWKSTCESLLSDRALLKSLEPVDLIVCDITSICCAIVADLLKVNRVDLAPIGFVDPYVSFIHNFPSPVAYVPHGTVKLPKRMSFLDRLQNLLLYILGYVMHEFVFMPPFEDLWRTHVKDSKFSSLSEVFRATGLLIIPHDFALDFPRPFGAHVKVVGPILPEEPKPLPEDTENFISHGELKELVVVSFGTVISNFKPEFVDTIAKGLMQVPSKVIWKYNGDLNLLPQNMSKNVRIVPWMKQNYLLGHTATKVFFTHGGLNSVLEGAYHGTPMVVLPLFGDQPANAMKVYEAGIGVILDLQKLTPNVVTNALLEVLRNSSYKENAVRVSRLIRHRRVTPTEEAYSAVTVKSSVSLEANASTKQKDGDSAASKTSLSSTTTGSQRRSRIKPTVVSVARSRPNAATKNKIYAHPGTNESDGKSKEENLTVSQGRLSDKEDQLSRRLIFDGEDSEVIRTYSSQEGNQLVTSTRNPVETSASLTNIEHRTQPVPQETVVNPSQIQNSNANSDAPVLQPSDGGTTPSLLRRKRVLPNLGSAARRRRSSLSKENVEKNPDFQEVRQEEINSACRDEGLISEQTAVDCSGSRSKRLRTLSEEDQNVDHGTPPVTFPEIHDKDDVEDDEESRKKDLKRKRGGRPHKLKEPSDPSHMTMQHLIYFNPKTNPMSSSLAGRKRKADDKNKSKSQKGQNPNNSQNKESDDGAASVRNTSLDSQEPGVDADETDGAAVAPRVKLAADGSIILDEERCKTQKFYMALSQVGTDFSLMTPLFPNRTRRELKAKFKREEKQHRTLIEKALRVRNPIDVDLFTPKVDEDDIDDELAGTDPLASTPIAQE